MNTANDTLASLRRRGVCMPVEHYGLWGGGMPKAAWLLAREMARLGVPVRVFTLNTTPEDVARSRGAGVRVTRVRLRKGHRWSLPQRYVALRGLAHALLRPRCIVAIGLDAIAAALLKSPLARRVAVWECTQATPGNKFVHPAAAARLRRGAAVLAPSAAIEANLRSTYAYDGPVIRLPFWIDPDEAADASPAPAADIDFLFLGRKDPEKGLFELLRAFAKLVKDRPASSLTICGTGDDAPYAREARDLGITPRVQLTYVKDHSRVGDLIRRSRWLVLPSYHEGYPLTPLEAFARSRPAILTRVGSVPEMCGDSPAAVVIPPCDQTALFNAMRAALAEPQPEYALRCAQARDLFQRLSGADAVRAGVTRALEQLAALTEP